jgi:penicillin-binding protein 1A
MKRIWKYAALGILIASALVLLIYVGFEATCMITESSLPEVIDRQRFDREIWQVSRVYARHGELLDEFFKERRTIVPIEELPEHLLQAVIAAEDKNFYTHHGVDWLAIARAVVVDTFRGRMVQGASTLTQQLARNLYLTHERSLKRKVTEALLGRKMEKALDKQTILHQYLNLIYLGHGNYGVEEASQFYFAKSARKLTFAESAMLAGLIKGPEVFSPVKAPEKARARMDYVLRQMRAAGYYSGSVEDVETPLSVGHRQVRHKVSPYGVDAALAILFRSTGRGGFDTGGYRVETKLDVKWQQALNETMKDHLEELGVSLLVSELEPDSLCDCIRDGVVGPGCAVWTRVIGRNRKGNATLVDVLGRVGVIPDDALERLSGDLSSVSLATGTYVRVLPDQEFSLTSPWFTEEILVIPVVSPQLAAVVLEASSGEVRAVYGGVDHRYHPFNRALTARRQIGSTIKPFLYLAALEMLGWGSRTRVDATALNLTKAGGRPWRIRDGHSHRNRLSIEEALAVSSNCAAVRTLQAVGVENFMGAWLRWGLPPLDVQDLSIALGSPSLSPLELAQAFALLANGRCAPEPMLLARVDGPDGVMALPARACLGLPPRHETRLIAEWLETVLTTGTGKQAAVEGVKAFGKTGTTSGGRDAWLAGVFFTAEGPQVLVIWVGSDDFSPIEGNSGPTTAAKLWKAAVGAIVALGDF